MCACICACYVQINCWGGAYVCACVHASVYVVCRLTGFVFVKIGPSELQVLSLTEDRTMRNTYTFH